MSELGKLISGYRKENNMNKTQLGKQLGIDRSYVSLLESGKRSLSMSLKVRLEANTSISKKALNKIFIDRYENWKAYPISVIMVYGVNVMNKKTISLKYKGYLIVKKDGYCFLYDRDGSNDDYPIMIDKDLMVVRETVDKLAVSPKIENENTYLN